LIPKDQSSPEAVLVQYLDERCIQTALEKNPQAAILAIKSFITRAPQQQQVPVQDSYNGHELSNDNLLSPIRANELKH
jgi:hypothetical protein